MPFAAQASKAIFAGWALFVANFVLLLAVGRKLFNDNQDGSASSGRSGLIIGGLALKVFGLGGVSYLTLVVMRLPATYFVGGFGAGLLVLVLVSYSSMGFGYKKLELLLESE